VEGWVDVGIAIGAGTDATEKWQYGRVGRKWRKEDDKWVLSSYEIDEFSKI